ncbi:auxin-induced protein X10A-like [Panicum miliaceum]|uniref:Auxin-induced protein X10A-like n=1 Tax=Panicum miliaceum TaxID=4540 RepID=A0A3L6RTD0_PANMI|nr:auxin-induced protein X10A-like [Panicum miliaceum]
MMAVKGYFRAPRLDGRKQQQSELYGGESPSAALLDAGDELAAVPRGYFAVYVGAEARRFVVPTSCLRQPAFRDLMERAAEEFGFAQAGGIRIPCREEDFEATVAALDAAVAARRRRRRRPNCPRPGRCSKLDAGQPCMQNCSHREESKGSFSSQTDLINSNQWKHPLVSIMLYLIRH